MNDKRIENSKLERITRKWWFFLIFIFLQFISVPYASKGYKWSQMGDLITYSLRNAFINSCSQLYPIFKIIPIVLITLLIIFKNSFCRLFNIYVAFSYLVFAFGQNIGVSEKFGLSIVTINLIMFLIVAGFWIWEAITVQNDFSRARIPLWRYWVVPPALIAFWAPNNLQGFNLFALFANGAGMAFCMMTPVYIGLLSLYFPRVNIVTLRVTSLVGVIIGLYNMFMNFAISPATRWWNGTLHIPLLIISIYGLVLSLTKTEVVPVSPVNPG